MDKFKDYELNAEEQDSIIGGLEDHTMPENKLYASSHFTMDFAFVELTEEEIILVPKGVLSSKKKDRMD